MMKTHSVFSCLGVPSIWWTRPRKINRQRFIPMNYTFLSLSKLQKQSTHFVLFLCICILHVTATTWVYHKPHLIFMQSLLMECCLMYVYGPTLTQNSAACTVMLVVSFYVWRTKNLNQINFISKRELKYLASFFTWYKVDATFLMKNKWKCI